MHRTMIRYRVKPDQAATNTELVRAVYDELYRNPPAGLCYATVRLPDGVSFIHLVETEGPDPLPRVRAFQRFRDGIGERCDQAPVVTELEKVGSFRIFGATAPVQVMNPDSTGASPS